MPLDNLRQAWKQVKLQNSLVPVEAHEILSIIEDPALLTKSSPMRMVINVVMFIVIILVVQGG